MLDKNLPEDILLPKSQLKLHFNDWFSSVGSSLLCLSVHLLGDVANVSQKQVFFSLNKLG